MVLTSTLIVLAAYYAEISNRTLGANLETLDMSCGFTTDFANFLYKNSRNLFIQTIKPGISIELISNVLTWAENSSTEDKKGSVCLYLKE